MSRGYAGRETGQARCSPAVSVLDEAVPVRVYGRTYGPMALGGDRRRWRHGGVGDRRRREGSEPGGAPGLSGAGREREGREAEQAGWRPKGSSGGAGTRGTGDRW
ncbi:hypothetical protein Sme01_04500 [Sphaerisporangium melleum]|uniref:Uncharacterized protein n=1 Tax=Sphaerisporangium melleum TaxID=321316 RepID=A0A917QPY9_9ACTN|nr:hypothetical protein GCM10007964_02050 [Sphaerisporangium melleum]GII67974.1 hypothetical protein Sme01_04500 [Sphaerisporangium melleum]